MNMSKSSFSSWNKINVLGESDYHTLKAYPSVLPVLLIEAVSQEGKMYIQSICPNNSTLFTLSISKSHR